MSGEAIDIDANREIGRRIYERSLGDRRGFSGDDIDADVWDEIFEDVGRVALAEVAVASGLNPMPCDDDGRLVNWANYGADLASSGDVTVGFAGRRGDGTCYWEISAVFMKNHGKQEGSAPTLAEAKSELEKNWAIWLEKPVWPRG